MLFYNDILFGIYKHIHGNEKAIGSSEFLVKEEIKSKRRLDHVRKKVNIFSVYINISISIGSYCLESCVKDSNGLDKKEQSVSKSYGQDIVLGNDDASLDEICQKNSVKNASRKG